MIIIMLGRIISPQPEFRSFFPVFDRPVQGRIDPRSIVTRMPAGIHISLGSGGMIVYPQTCRQGILSPFWIPSHKLQFQPIPQVGPIPDPLAVVLSPPTTRFFPTLILLHANLLFPFPF